MKGVIFFTPFLFILTLKMVSFFSGIEYGLALVCSKAV